MKVIEKNKLFNKGRNIRISRCIEIVMDFLHINSVDKCAFFPLPDWNAWEKAAKNLPELIKERKLRSLVDEVLPVVRIDDLKGRLGAIKRAYTIFTFIAHAYIRGSAGEAILTVKYIFLDAKNVIIIIGITCKDFIGVD